MSLDSFQPSVLIHPLSSPLPLKLPFPHHWSVSTHFYVLGLQMTRTVLLRKKDKKIYSLQTSFYKFTSQLLQKSCQFPYNLPISFCKLRVCWRFQGWDALCVKVMVLEWQLLLPMTLIREPLSREPGPIPTSWAHLSHCQPQGLSPRKQQRRTGSPSRRDLSISEGGKSRLEQEAARCSLYICRAGLPQEGLGVGTLQKPFKGVSCLKGSQELWNVSFLANCEEEELPR